MVWPPPKVLKSPEGEITVERPHAGAHDESVVTGVPEAQRFEASSSRASPSEGQPARPIPPALPGATVSVMAATAVPRDWLERPEALIGCVLGSRYRVVGIIGRGPMGIACEGESSRGRQVTLKLLPRAPELPVEHFGWQLRQALALAHFDHPNVTPISDFGPLEDGGAFVSRSRVPGVTLRTMLRQGALPLRRSLDIARQVAAALAAGHAQEIAHGRLKPENIVVQGGPGGGDVVKVIDFGMAGLPVNLRAVAPNEREARALSLRTRLYLPADVTGASPAIDVYSLGVILFELIAGRPPFAFDTPPAPGAEPEPLSFAPLSFEQCDPSLVVPASVNELVFALLRPNAMELGLNAARVGEMLDGLLGRPSIAPAPEPVTAQLQSAPERDAAERTNAAAAAPFAAPSAASMVWPSSPPPAPARAHSFPPLPQGFVSTFPPAATEPAPSRSEPPQAAEAAFGIRDSGPGAGPPSPRSALPPSSRSVPPTPPSRRGSAAQAPSARRSPSTIDEPFATPSFPPPSVPEAPASPEISVVAHGAGASTMPPMPGSPDDLDELELRPSFIGRLKRLLGGKKRPSGF